MKADVKPDNMLLDMSMSDEQIEEWLSTLPDDNRSHPLPLPTGCTPNCPLDVAKQIRVTLIDFGQGMFSRAL
jgi:hypothetical protein